MKNSSNPPPPPPRRDGVPKQDVSVLSALLRGSGWLGISVITVFNEGFLLRLAHFVSPLVFSITYVPAEYLEEFKASVETRQHAPAGAAPPPK